MRSQVYAWNGSNFNPALATAAANAYSGGTAAVPGNNLTGVQTSIFIGGFGNNITKPAETTATEFVVIEDVSCTPTLNATARAATNNFVTVNTLNPLPANALVTGQLAGWQLFNGSSAGDLFTVNAIGVFGPRMYVQVRINTTDYFLNPDNVTNDGIPGTASPYPRSLDMQPSFNLYPDVYVLPGQVWDVRVTSFCLGVNWGKELVGAAAPTGTFGNGKDFNAFCKYTLYDGPDALIANKLLEMGISINPGNVDWYKRSLLSAQGM
tara:strand:- start:4746 stop:5543 length:798 start_codon:yes stop_codon:yes gene_type:complete